METRQECQTLLRQPEGGSMDEAEVEAEAEDPLNGVILTRPNHSPNKSPDSEVGSLAREEVEEGEQQEEKWGEVVKVAEEHGERTLNQLIGSASLMKERAHIKQASRGEKSEGGREEVVVGEVPVEEGQVGDREEGEQIVVEEDEVEVEMFLPINPHGQHGKRGVA
jgi:hypothetical protein